MIRKSLLTLLPLTSFLLAGPCFAKPTAHHAGLHHNAVRSASKLHKVAAPAGMSAERATEIQTALIKAGYMQGEPTGVWNAESVAAMQKMQGDNGWQTKITPDSRALIKLGLGPQSGETASTPGTGAIPGS